MSDEYVRKDLYDEGIKRIEAMMAASEARLREYAARQDAQIASIRADIRELKAITNGLNDTIAAYTEITNQRIDDITKKPSLTERIISGTFAVIGIAIGLAGLLEVVTVVILIIKL